MTQDISFDVVNNFARYFNSIILEALPFVVLGVIIAGILEEFIPQAWIRFLFGGSASVGAQKARAGGVFGLVQRLVHFPVIAISMGALLGLVFPMCECGIIAIIRRLVRKGVPLSVCIAYMLAGPIINVIVLLSTYVAFNPPDAEDYVLGGPFYVTLLRAGLGFVIAVTTGLIIHFQFKRFGFSLVQPHMVPKQISDDDNSEPKEKRTLAQRAQAITGTALHDFVDIMTFLILGAALASMARMSMDIEAVDELTRYVLQEGHPSIAILLMMILTVLFCLCSEVDAFVAANFPRVWPPASKMAFLVLGPMLDIKLYVMFTYIFRQRLIWTIIIAVVVQTFLYTLALHYLWGYIPGMTEYGYPPNFLLRGR